MLAYFIIISFIPISFSGSGFPVQTNPAVHMLVSDSLGFVTLILAKAKKWARVWDSRGSPLPPTSSFSDCRFQLEAVYLDNRVIQVCSFWIKEEKSMPFPRDWSLWLLSVFNGMGLFCLSLSSWPPPFFLDVQPASSQPASEQHPLAVHIPHCVSTTGFPHTAKVCAAC